jgi:hypothetical protein
MLPHEIDAFLEEQRVCRLASMTLGDRPHVSPLWFVWDGAALWLNSVVRSQRWRDLERNPWVSAVIDAGEDYTELRGVELSGQIHLRSEAPRTSAPLAAVADAELRFARKYSGVDEFRPDGRHAWLCLVPEKIVSWDFRKNPQLQSPRGEPDERDGSAGS